MSAKMFSQQLKSRLHFWRVCVCVCLHGSSSCLCCNLSCKWRLRRKLHRTDVGWLRLQAPPRPPPTAHRPPPTRCACKFNEAATHTLTHTPTRALTLWQTLEHAQASSFSVAYAAPHKFLGRIGPGKSGALGVGCLTVDKTPVLDNNQTCLPHSAH